MPAAAITGPDQGKGGKYLCIGPDHEGEISEDYVVAKFKTYRHWLFMRVFVKDGDLEGSTKALQEGFRCAPRAKANKPPKQIIKKRPAYGVGSELFCTGLGFSFAFPEVGNMFRELSQSINVPAGN